MSQAATTEYALPASLVGRADLARLLREVEQLDNDLEAQRVRGGKADAKMPPLSRGLSDFVELNKLDIMNDQGRMLMKERLRVLKDKAPILHLTFATEADPDTVQRLVGWLRREMHPHTLLSIGLQPSLVAGVYVRTPNHVHDFSVRTLLAGKREVIARELESYNAG